jgi:hypothetical protein
MVRSSHGSELRDELLGAFLLAVPLLGALV